MPGLASSCEKGFIPRTNAGRKLEPRCTDFFLLSPCYWVTISTCALMTRFLEVEIYLIKTPGWWFGSWTATLPGVRIKVAIWHNSSLLRQMFSFCIGGASSEIEWARGGLISIGDDEIKELDTDSTEADWMTCQISREGWPEKTWHILSNWFVLKNTELFNFWTLASITLNQHRKMSE